MRRPREVDGGDASKFNADDVLVMRPQCHFCQRWRQGSLTCEAFPNGIPQGVLLNQHDHFEKRVQGDNNLLALPLQTNAPSIAELFPGLTTHELAQIATVGPIANSFALRWGARDE